MLAGLLLMTLAAWAYAIAVALERVASIIIERERGAVWISQLPEMRRLVRT
jgi:heme exporter protein C